MADKGTAYKEHWGVRFSVVPQGLSEQQVVNFVNDLIAKSKPQSDQEKHSSLLRLAEQTVVEAEKLATEIKERAKKQIEAEAAKVKEEALASAKEAAAKLAREAEKDAAEKVTEAAERATHEAHAIITKAKREGQVILEEARARVKSTESEMRLEAEFVVRRMTQNVAEGLRRAVTDTTNQILPAVDELVSELRTEFKSEEAAAAAPKASSSKSNKKR